MEMKMTFKAGCEIMDALALIYASANGIVKGVTPSGEPIVSSADIQKAEEYARAKFEEIMGEWEDAKGVRWEIVECPADE